MTGVTVIQFVPKSALYVSTSAVNKWLVNAMTWPQSRMNGGGWNVEGKIKQIREIENGKNKGDLCRQFGLVNSTTHTILKKQNQNYEYVWRERI
jgi:hypothetical protein